MAYRWEKVEDYIIYDYTKSDGHYNYEIGEKHMDIFKKFCEDNDVIEIAHNKIYHYGKTTRMLGKAALEEHRGWNDEFLGYEMNPLIDHIRLIKFKDGRIAVVSQPYYDVDELKDKTLQEYADECGYCIIAFDKKYSWYNPDTTSLIIICNLGVAVNIVANNDFKAIAIPKMAAYMNEMCTKDFDDFINRIAEKLNKFKAQ